MNKCRAVGCCNLQGDTSIHFFRFPLEEKRCMQWKQFVELVGDVPPEKCHKNMRLCHFHFDEKYYISSKKNRLHKNAIPTIRLVDIPTTSGNTHTSREVKPLCQGELEEESEICMIEESCTETDVDPLAMNLESNEAVKLELDEEVKLELDEEVKLELDEEVKLELDEEVKLELDEEVKLELDEEVKLELDEEEKLESDEEVKLEFDEEVKLEFDEEVKLELDEEAPSLEKAYKNEYEAVNY